MHLFIFTKKEGSLFCWSICLSVCQYCTVLITSFVVNFEITKCEPSSFVFLVCLCSLEIPHEFLGLIFL